MSLQIDSSASKRSVRFRTMGLYAGLFTLIFAISLAPFVAAQGSISVIVPDVQDPGRDYYTNVLVPAFEEETGIEVELTLMAWGGYIDHLVTLFAAGQAPDVLQVGGEALGTFIHNGLVQPIDRWADGWDQLDDFAPTAILDGTVDGKLYTIPYRLDQRPLLYRIDFFEEAGLDGSSPPETWSELRDAAAKLARTDSTGELTRSGFNTGPAGDLSAIFIWQNGGQLVSEDGQRAIFDSPESIEAIQFLSDLVNEAQVGWPTGSPWEGADPIVTGRTAMEYHGDWALGQMDNVDPDNAHALGVALPAGQVTRSGFLYVNKWAISSQAQNPDGAWRWIEYVSRPDILYELSRVNSFLPARRSAIDGPPFSEDPRWAVFLEAAELTQPLPGNTRNLVEVLAQLSQAVASVLNQEEPASSALSIAAEQATLAISSN